MARKAKATSRLPEPFQDLEPFVDWALAKESERTQKRLASSLKEVQAFYDAMLPRMDVVVEYLNQFPLERLPKDAERLFQLSLSLMEVANAIELYRQPKLPLGFEVSRFVPVEDI